MTTKVVIGQPADCSIFWLRWLQSSSCQVLFLLQWQLGSWTQQTGDVVSSPMRCQKSNEVPVYAYTGRSSLPVCRWCAYDQEASELINCTMGPVFWHSVYLILSVTIQMAGSLASWYQSMMTWHLTYASMADYYKETKDSSTEVNSAWPYLPMQAGIISTSSGHAHFCERNYQVMLCSIGLAPRSAGMLAHWVMYSSQDFPWHAQYR